MQRLQGTIKAKGFEREDKSVEKTTDIKALGN